MSFCRRFLPSSALCLAFVLLLAPTRVRAESNRTTSFALDASYYPRHVFVNGRVAADHEADHFIGELHRSAFAQLGRHPDQGWLQGAVWEPAFRIRHPGATGRVETGLIITGYLVSEYDSTQGADGAVRDLYLPHHRWRHLKLGKDGRIVELKDAGYSVLAAGFAEGDFDVENVTLVSPGTPRRFYRRIKAFVMGQLKALDKIGANVDTSSQMIRKRPAVRGVSGINY